MTKKRKVTPAAPAAAAPYQPPQQLLVHCPQCDCTVLRGIVKGGEIVWQEPALSPVTGGVHNCDQALAHALRVQGLRWNTVRVVAEHAMRALSPTPEPTP